MPQKRRSRSRSGSRYSSACTRPPSRGRPQSAGTTVVLGTKNFPEEYILGQLYKQALEAKGFSVTYKENIGSTELIQTSLTSGKINMYPEYTGVIVQDVFHHKLSAKTAAGTYKLAQQLEATKGFTLLNATPFFDTDVLAVTERDREEVRAEVRRRPEEGRQLQARRLPGVQDAEHVFPGLHQEYGITKATFLPLAGISAYAALDAGTVLAADVFSTDPPLGKGSKYTVLADPKHVTGFQNVAPIVKTSVATALGSKFTSTVNAVSAKLTQNAIVAMNKAVIVDKQSAAKVAKAFLKANGLA